MIDVPEDGRGEAKSERNKQVPSTGNCRNLRSRSDAVANRADSRDEEGKGKERTDGEEGREGQGEKTQRYFFASGALGPQKGIAQP